MKLFWFIVAFTMLFTPLAPAGIGIMLMIGLSDAEKPAPVKGTYSWKCRAQKSPERTGDKCGA